MHWIRHPKDFWSGVLFVVVGVAAIVISSNYPMGTAARMGPGYFPRLLGGLLIVFGALLAVRALRTTGVRIAPWRLRPLVFVLGSVVVFGYIVHYTGVLLGTVLLIVAASAASHEFRPKEALIAGVLLGTVAVLVFLVGLKLQLPIWPLQR
jgi:hypothetical protein